MAEVSEPVLGPEVDTGRSVVDDSVRSRIIQVLKGAFGATCNDPVAEPPAPDRRSIFELTDTDKLMALGFLAAGLLIDRGDWVFRRVESVSVVAERRIRRQMSIDFRIPTEKVEAIRLAGFDTFPVPLLLLGKKPLMSFDLRDQAD